MKLDIDKIEIKNITDNIYSIYHDTNILKFWSNKLCIPFGLEKDYNKTIIKLELEENNENHQHLKKVIQRIETLIRKKINANENDFKSVIKKRPNKCDVLELRIKMIKNKIITDIEYEDKDNHYLKTIYDLPKQSYIKTQIEINGLWDYRTEEKNKNMSGLIVYATKIIVLK